MRVGKITPGIEFLLEKKKKAYTPAFQRQLEKEKAPEGNRKEQAER